MRTINLFAARSGQGVPFCALSLLLLAQPLLADAFTFDPDGPGPLSPLVVASFDWSVDNALAADGNQAVANFIANGYQSGPNTLFNLYYHARLAQFIDPNSLQHNVPAGIEFTLVAGFQEDVVAVFGNAALFRATGAPQSGQPGSLGKPPYVPNFVEIYYDDTPDAVPLTGQGYNDGTLILSAVVLPDPFASTVFLTIDGGPNTRLDAYGPDNYPHIKSVTGIGSSQLTLAITYAHPAFFLVDSLVSSIFNTTNSLNFTEINPSANWVYAPGGAAALPGGAGVPGLPNPELGQVNGAPPNQLGGPSIQFQVDGSQSFIIPEPLTLTVLSLLSLALIRRPCIA